MQVAGERVRPGNELRVVAERQAVDAPRLRTDFDAEVRRRGAGLQVVIALDEHDVEGSAGLPPGAQGGQRGGRVRFRRVKEIAEEDERSGLRPVEHRLEARQRLARRALGHRDPARAKGRRLAEVRIGDDEAAARSPVDRAGREQFERLAAELDLQLRLHSSVTV